MVSKAVCTTETNRIEATGFSCLAPDVDVNEHFAFPTYVKCDVAVKHFDATLG